MKFLILFAALSLFNVIFSTIKSIALIKSSIPIACLTSGAYYAFYNIMIIYTVIDYPMWQKCLITMVCNVVGIAVVLSIQNALRKDKLWLVKVTVPSKNFREAYERIKRRGIPVSYYDLDKYYVLDCFCSTAKQTKRVKEVCRFYGGKMFASENKLAL